MADVFDDELMKELGLDPSEFQETPPAKPAAKVPAGTQPGANKSVAPAGSAVTPPAGGVKPAAPAARPQQTPAPPVRQVATPTAQQRPPAPPVSAAAPKSAREAAPVSSQSQVQKISGEIPVQMAAVLAKKTMRLSEILTLNVGEVLEFKKQPTEPLDLVANGKLVAKAELVVVDGKLGVRIVKLVR